MIEMRQFIYLDAVYRHKNFTKASKALYVSQPTISAAVRALETSLGVRLIERTPKAVIFTEAGEKLMVRVRSLLSEYNDIIAEANELSHKANYTLRLGIASIMSSDIFPLIYKDFLPSHNRLSIHLDEDSAFGHIKKLLDEELDLAFNGIPESLDTTELRCIPVCEREIKLIMHRDHPLAQLESVQVDRLNGVGLSLLSSSGVMGQLLMDTFTVHKLELNIVSEHTQILGMLEMVRTGQGIGFVNLPKEARSMPGCEDLILRSFEDPLTFMVGFMMKKRKYMPPMCKELISFISGALGCAENN